MAIVPLPPPHSFRVSLSNRGAQGNAASFDPRPSFDGNVVVFTSNASNLVPNDTNAASDVFLYNRNSRTLELVSHTAAGTTGNGASAGAVVSGNGRFVAFGSAATDLAGAPSGSAQIFLYDDLTKSIKAIGVGGAPRLSADGNLLAYVEGPRRIQILDQSTGTTQTIDLPDGREVGGFGFSPNGRYVAFGSRITNGVTGDLSIIDLSSGATKIVESQIAFGPRIRPDAFSGDGQFFVYTSSLDRPVLYDQASGQFTGLGPARFGPELSISSDGRYIAGALAQDSSGVRSAIYDRVAGDFLTGRGGGIISGDGAHLVGGALPRLGDTNQAGDVYISDLSGPPAGAWHRSPAELSEFGWAQGWRSPSYHRLVNDIDHNGSTASADYVGFGAGGVVFALGGTWNNGTGLGSGFKTFPDSFQIHDFGTAQGYDATFARGVDYVGNFGTPDDTVWAQGNAGIFYYVPTSETAITDDAGHAQYIPHYEFGGLYRQFGHDQGWNSHFNFDNVIIGSDSYASILGFGASGLIIGPQAYAPGADASQSYLSNFPGPGSAKIGNVDGWDSVNDIRTFKDAFGFTIDIDKNGLPEFVGIGPQGLVVAFGQRDAAGKFQLGPLQSTQPEFGGAQGWNNSNTIRYIADLNGDGAEDVIGFGAAGALVSLGGAREFPFFRPAYLGIADFGWNQGWLSPTAMPRLIGDVNGDGIPDIVGFGNEFTLTALGALDTAGKVSWHVDPSLSIHDYTIGQGWDDTTVRQLADVDGDGKAELVVSGGAGTHTWDLF